MLIQRSDKKVGNVYFSFIFLFVGLNTGSCESAEVFLLVSFLFALVFRKGGLLHLESIVIESDGLRVKSVSADAEQVILRSSLRSLKGQGVYKKGKVSKERGKVEENTVGF